jgi:hypothetical protein
MSRKDLTPLQHRWAEVVAALEAAYDLSPDEFDAFLSKLTIRVADENIRAVKRWL